MCDLNEQVTQVGFESGTLGVIQFIGDVRQKGQRWRNKKHLTLSTSRVGYACRVVAAYYSYGFVCGWDTDLNFLKWP